MTVPILASSFLSLERQSHLLEGRRARLITLIAGCILIPIWQLGFFSAGDALSSRYRVQASTGVLTQARFVYFLYYLGLYPVATEKDDVAYSRSGARDVIAHHGDTLLTEWQHSYRSGSLGTTLLYLPGALLKGSARDPSVRPANAIAFTLALAALFVAFWHVRQPILGIILVLFLGSNPFQLHEVYARENAFGAPITTAIFLLALHLPLLAERSVATSVSLVEEGRKRDARGHRERKAWPYYLWAAPAAAGILLATAKQIRPEPLILIFSPIACYLILAKARWLVRGGLVAVLIVSYAASTWAWSAWFDAKLAQANRVVAAAGGHVYNGPRSHSHLFWHPIWCGLGDFGSDRGYKWDDMAAADYALPILEAKYGVKVPKVPRERVLFRGAFWDPAGRYYVMPYELPHYEEVVRDKVLHDIVRDPFWYLAILAQRAWRILAQTTPPSIAVGAASLPIPMHGILLIPVLVLLAARRAWMPLKLVCFLLPLSLPALLIFSGQGMCLYSCYHLVVAALIAAWLLEALLWRTERRRDA